MVKAKKTKPADLTKSVMKKIEQKEIKMRPRLYFVAGSFLLGAGMAGALALAMFFVHLAMFRFRAHAPLALLQLGRPGLRVFLMNFPWWPLLVAIGGLAGGIGLLKRFEISYKKSFLVLVIGLVALVITFGFLLDQTRPEKRLRGLKPIRPFYQAPFDSQSWLTGEVIEVKESRLRVETSVGNEAMVGWDEKTRIPFKNSFKPGDQVRVVGEWEKEIFKAQGIIKVGNHRSPNNHFPKRVRF